MPPIASLETYFLKIFWTLPGVLTLRALGIHPLATLIFWLTTSKSVENTANSRKRLLLTIILLSLQAFCYVSKFLSEISVL